MGNPRCILSSLSRFKNQKVGRSGRRGVDMICYNFDIVYTCLPIRVFGRVFWIIDSRFCQERVNNCLSSLTMTSLKQPIPNEPPPGPFFLDSDDEDDGTRDVEMLPREEPLSDDIVVDPSAAVTDDLQGSPSLPQTPRTSSSRSSPMIQKLFLDSDSDDPQCEITTSSTKIPAPDRRQASEAGDSDIEIIEKPAGFSPREKGSSAKFNGKSKRDESPGSPGPVSKKRRVSPIEAPIVAPPVPASDFQSTYLGEIVVPNAWSNVSGKGYIKPNDSVIIKRDEDEPVPGTQQG